MVVTMAQYKAVSRFTDLQDGNHAYNEGETYPRDGYKASPERIAELSGFNNNAGRPLIEAVVEQVADDGNLHNKRFTKRDRGRTDD